MESQNNENMNRVRTLNKWYRCAVASAIICALFSLAVLSIIVINFIQNNQVDIKEENELLSLKAQIQNRPDDQQLLSQIRNMDLKYRQQYFLRENRSRKGAYLLIGGIAMLVLSIKLAKDLKKKILAPRPPEKRQDDPFREAFLSRWSITFAILILGSATILLATRKTIEYPKPITIDKSWPTMAKVEQNWPTFRGPHGLGISAYTNIPENWNGQTGQNILWKTEIPLQGKNSPIVWDNRVFLSGADPNQNMVFCYDADSGKLLWGKNVVHTSGELNLMPEDSSYAAPTAATDGRRVYAIFPTGDIGCFDFEGRKLWEKSFGIPDNMYGFASSLTMSRNLVIIQNDQISEDEQEKSVLLALEGYSGEAVWETKRPIENSWSSPIVVKIEDKYQIITCGEPWIIGYDAENGQELWRADCLGADTAPSPIYANGLVIGIEPYSKIVAVNPNGSGDVTESHIAWTINEGGPDICSPIADSEHVYTLGTDGWFSCFNFSDQKRLWGFDLRDSFTASPVLVGDKLYLLSEDGIMHIIQTGPEHQEIARCELGEESSGSPAFTDGRIYIRGVENLYCIGNRN